MNIPCCPPTCVTGIRRVRRGKIRERKDEGERGKQRCVNGEMSGCQIPRHLKERFVACKKQSSKLKIVNSSTAAEGLKRYHKQEITGIRWQYIPTCCQVGKWMTWPRHFTFLNCTWNRKFRQYLTINHLRIQDNGFPTALIQNNENTFRDKREHDWVIATPLATVQC